MLQPARVEPRQARPPAEELRPREQRHQWLREEEDHDQVDERRQAQGEGEAADAADRDVVEDRRGEDRHEVGRHDRAPGSAPAGLDADAQRVPSLISSRMRSKNTMNESAVMPMAATDLVTPARVSVKPIVIPRITTRA